MPLTVCQSHPSSPATSFTLRACRPTWRVAHRAARAVRTWRGAAMRWSSSVPIPSCSRDRRSATGACATRGGLDDRRAGGRRARPGIAPSAGRGPRSPGSRPQSSSSRWDPGLAALAALAAPEPGGRKSDHPLDRARRVSLHGAPPRESLNNSRVVGPRYPIADPPATASASAPRSFPKRQFMPSEFDFSHREATLRSR